ncbi:hypothetical protein L208DRAFT_1258680 [Tricholoma matsutake]|nr:hypothetical protein L208DRAFT_1258680 [Tricholoma matsutake 945]
MQVEPGPTPASTSKAADLQAQIQCLIDLHSRLKSLRQIPYLVLKPATSTSADGLPVSPHSQPSLRTEFEHVKEIGNVIRSEPIQEALRTARDSFQADSKDLNFNLRRENRKRRRAPSPESPQPYVAHEGKSASLFPLEDMNAEPLRTEELVNYIRDFNRTSKCKLQLWRKTRVAPLLVNPPTVLRFGIPDVLIGYLSLVYTPTDSILVCESVTFFAPRERKPPHSQSDYAAYQALSQQMASILHSHPRVSVQSVIKLLCSYEGLFVDSCKGCSRVLSMEGHVPPVVRMWKESGEWEGRHVGCAEAP